STPPAPPSLCPGSTPMPKNLFANWESDSPSLSFMPRLCNLTLMKMVVFKELEKDLISMVIAMKMQGSNLMSMVITMKMQGSNGQLETDLGLTSLKDPHFPCEEATSYRSCCTGGTLRTRPSGARRPTYWATSTWPRSGSDPSRVAKEAEEASAKVAEIWICSLSNQPIQWEDSAIQDRCKAKSRLNCSEGVYQSFACEQQATYGPNLAEVGIDMGMLKKQRPWILGKTSITRPQNIKEKVVAWLEKFKVLEEAVDSTEHVPELEWDLDHLFNTLQNPRDSGPDMEGDNSTLSTPKPKLILFFEGLAHSNSQTEMVASIGPGANRILQIWPKCKKTHGPSGIKQPSDSVSDSAAQSTPSPKTGKKMTAFSAPPNPSSGHTAKVCHISVQKWIWGASMAPRARRSFQAKQRSLLVRLKCPRRPSSFSNSQPDPGSQLQIPRKTTYNQLNQILISDDQLPENIILVTSDWQEQFLSDNLQGLMLPVLCICFMADVRVFSFIIWWIQRYCNDNSKPPKPVKILVAGAQHYFSAVLQVFLELLSYKMLGWLGYEHFLVIPLGSHPVARYLGSINYRDLFHKLDAQSAIQDTLDIVTRITQYITGTTVPPSCSSRKPCSPTSRRAPMSIPYSSFFSGRQVKVGIVQQSSGTSGDSEDGP
uniref:Uncharacterized protein n=1 Tax=Myotis lucifugus TaxID=59463 RepID=G1PZ05_MYOLU